MPATSYPASGDAPAAEEPTHSNPGDDPKELGPLIRKRWDDGSGALASARRDYWTNLSFYLGQQWLWWDEVRNMVDQLPLKWSPLGPDKQHVTDNRIAPNLGILLGRMLRSSLAFDVPPSAGSDGAIQGARLAGKALESYHRDQDWESVRHDGLAGTFFGGTGFVMVEWDGTKGTELTYDQGLDKIVGTGDCWLRALNVGEAVLEPGCRHGIDSRWGIVAIAAPCDQAQEQYHLDWKPEPDVSAGRTPLHLSMLESSGRPTSNDQCLVLSMYERPHEGCRKGRYAISINDRIVYSGPWPFPFKNLNIHAMRQRRIDGHYFGSTLLNDAVKIQYAYNFARSVLAEHLHAIGNMRIAAERGSFSEDEFTNKVGDIFWYQPGSQPPGYIAPPNLARWVSAEPENLLSSLDVIMHVSDIARGQGFDRASGQALALLSEKDETPLGTMAQEQASVWGRVGSQVLKLLEAKGSASRKVTIPLTRGVAQELKFSGKMLRGQTTANVPLEAVMALPRAAREAFWKDLWDRKIVTDPRRYARGVGLPPEDFEQLLDPDAAKAHSENYRMIQGIVEFPDDFDNHAVHMSEHNVFRKSDEYKFGDPDAKKIIDDHIAYHEKEIAAEAAKQAARAAGPNPLAAALPQADEPMGAYKAPTGAEQQAAAMNPGADQNAGAEGMDLPPGGTTPALASGQPAPPGGM